jgi:FkbM family methyltransferase
VVVLEGAAHASRVGVSLLANVGLPQLVARTADEYVAIAARLAADLPALAALREGLRERVRTSPLADGPGGARALEDALRQMWSGWCARQGPGNPRRSGPATDTRHVVIQTDYGPMIFPRGDSMIRANVIVDGAWEKDEIELLRWFMNACYGSEQEVEILDIGAYNGIYAIALARFAFPKVTVHAFEAQREIFELLTATVALNRLDNVRCHHKAVSSEGGAVIRFRPVDYSAPANFGSVEIEPVARPDFDGHRLEEATESVETVRIDDLGFRRVRLMKIDVEGMEHKVLAGAADTIRRCRPLIFLEYEKTDFAAVKAFLREAGYRSYYAQRPNILCVPADFTHIAIDGARPVEY